jgi:hypothetical protein
MMAWWRRIFGGREGGEGAEQPSRRETPTSPTPPAQPTPPAPPAPPAAASATPTQDQYAAARAKALGLLAAGDPKSAFNTFRWTLEDPQAAATLEDARWPDALDVLARISDTIAGPQWAEHLRRAAREPRNPQHLYELGFQLIEQSLHAMAATVLARANRLAPGQAPILAEFVVALEHLGRNAEACRVLREQPDLLERDPICRYLLAFNTLMCADIAGARELLLPLRDVPDPQVAAMVAQVEPMLRRADRLKEVSPLDDRDLRGWHAVITGGLLLHLSPYGLDEPMRGRYAMVQDSESMCLQGLRRLSAALEAWDLRPPRVLLLPEDRDSEALGLAAATLLNLPAERWSDRSDAPGLVVAYDVAALPQEVRAWLRPHRPGQLLFSQASVWTAEPPFVSDATTFLYQLNHSPWQAGRLRVDPQTHKTELSPAVQGTARELADRVTRAEVDPSEMSDLQTLRRLAAAMRPTDQSPATADRLFGAFRSTGNRARQRADSPVKSSRFN